MVRSGGKCGQYVLRTVYVYDDSGGGGGGLEVEKWRVKGRATLGGADVDRPRLTPILIM
jgi:hypothetical protein